jgi:hypothetical protein
MRDAPHQRCKPALHLLSHQAPCQLQAQPVNMHLRQVPQAAQPRTARREQGSLPAGRHAAAQMTPGACASTHFSSSSGGKGRWSSGTGFRPLVSCSSLLALPPPALLLPPACFDAAPGRGRGLLCLLLLLLLLAVLLLPPCLAAGDLLRCLLGLLLLGWVGLCQLREGEREGRLPRGGVSDLRWPLSLSALSRSHSLFLSLYPLSGSLLLSLRLLLSLLLSLRGDLSLLLSLCGLSLLLPCMHACPACASNTAAAPAA